MMKGENSEIEGQNIYMSNSFHWCSYTYEGDITKDDEVIFFIDKYILCSIPDEKAHRKLGSVVNS